MSVKGTIEQAIRAWLKVGAVAPGGTPLVDARVILAERGGPRPALPYLTVKVITPGTMIGAVDERIDGLDEDDAPTTRVRGARRATVSVQAFGDGAIEWLEEAVLSLARPAMFDQLTAAGGTVSPLGGAVDLSAVVDTGFEARVAQDFDVHYRLTSDPDTAIPASTVEMDYTSEGAGGTLEVPIVIDTT